jgi:predicted DNA-binding transcriptional regulator YafY
MESSGLIDRLHAAIEARNVLRLDYRDQDGHASAREIEPLCLAFWGGSWTIGAWCRLRADFRSFRPDRIDAIVETGEIFVDDAARGLEAYLRRVGGA